MQYVTNIQVLRSFVNVLFLVCALLMGSGVTSGEAVAAEPTYFPGQDTSQWVLPPPLVRPEFARPISNSKINGVYEGELYLAKLPADQRETVLKEGALLYGEEDEDSKKSKDGGIKGYIRAVAIFDQPKARTLELMTEPSKLALFLESLDGSVTVARSEVGEISKFSVGFLWWDIDFWIQHWFYPELSRYDWYMDTKNFDNEIDGNKGFWQLYALDDKRTIGEYGVYVDTGIPCATTYVRTHSTA